jgi:hypothetical protein
MDSASATSIGHPSTVRTAGSAVVDSQAEIVGTDAGVSPARFHPELRARGPVPGPAATLARPRSPSPSRQHAALDIGTMPPATVIAGPTDTHAPGAILDSSESTAVATDLAQEIQTTRDVIRMGGKIAPWLADGTHATAGPLVNGRPRTNDLEAMLELVSQMRTAPVAGLEGTLSKTVKKNRAARRTRLLALTNEVSAEATALEKRLEGLRGKLLPINKHHKLRNSLEQYDNLSTVASPRSEIAKIKADFDALQEQYLHGLRGRSTQFRGPAVAEHNALADAATRGLAALNRCALDIALADAQFSGTRLVYTLAIESNAAAGPQAEAAKEAYDANLQSFRENLPAERKLAWQLYVTTCEALRIEARMPCMTSAERMDSHHHAMSAGLNLSVMARHTSSSSSAIVAWGSVTATERVRKAEVALATSVWRGGRESALGDELGHEYGSLVKADLQLREGLTSLTRTSSWKTPSNVVKLRRLVDKLASVAAGYGELADVMADAVVDVELPAESQAAIEESVVEMQYRGFAAASLCEVLTRMMQAVAVSKSAVAAPRQLAAAGGAAEPAGPAGVPSRPSTPVAGPGQDEPVETLEQSLAVLGASARDVAKMFLPAADQSADPITFPAAKLDISANVHEACTLMEKSSETFDGFLWNLTTHMKKDSLKETSKWLDKSLQELKEARRKMHNHGRLFSDLHKNVGRLEDRCKHLSDVSKALLNDPKSARLTAAYLEMLEGKDQLFATLPGSAIGKTSDGNPLIEVALEIEPLKIGEAGRAPMAFPGLLLHMHLKPAARGKDLALIDFDDIGESGAVSVKPVHQRYWVGRDVSRVPCSPGFGLRMLQRAIENRGASSR